MGLTLASCVLSVAVAVAEPVWALWRDGGKASGELVVDATSAIPLYGRSADNLRDHRHVTSLLNRVTAEKFGLSLCPTMSFNERGHLLNSTVYYVLGVDDVGHNGIDDMDRNSEARQQPPGDESTDDADDDIADQAIAGAADDQACEPPGDGSDNEEDDQ